MRRAVRIIAAFILLLLLELSLGEASIGQSQNLSCSAPIRIMPLGDSITKGEIEGLNIPALEIGYRKELWDQLTSGGYSVNFVGGLTNGSAYSGFDAHHEGHEGYRDDQIASNIYNNGGANWLSANPADVILLHIGTNSLSSSETDVRDILDEIDEFENDTGIHITVVLARIINRSCSTDTPPCSQSTTTTTFNNNVEAMAISRIASGDDIIIVDMEEGAGIDYHIDPLGDMSDNLHPAQSGYDKMAFVWYDALTNFLPFCGNRAPQVTNPGSQSDEEGDVISLQIVASDPDGDGLSYGAADLPNGLSIHPSSGLISGTIAYDAAAGSPYNVVVTVTDDGSPPANSQVSFSWTVANVNRPPEATNPGNQSDVEGDEISLQIVASDPDGDGLSYGATGLPGGLSIHPSSGLISGTIAYGAVLNSPYNVVVTVTDNGNPNLNDQVSFSWTVADNQGPQATDPGDQTNVEGDVVSLQIEASDPDGDDLSYSAVNLPPGLSIDVDTGLISGSLPLGALGSYQVEVTVSDGETALDDTVTFTWRVIRFVYLPLILR